MRESDTGADTALTWALRVCVALVFVGTGLEKFPSGPGYWVQVFDTIGLGQWFRYFTGVVETLGGLLFLIPRATTLGALLLASAMVGAMVVQVVVFREPANVLFPGAYLAGVVVAYAKLRARRRNS
jgi:uncharacterized membrane protein YphA (DoxX/SURF4 family)